MNKSAFHSQIQERPYSIKFRKPHMLSHARFSRPLRRMPEKC